MKVSRKTQSLLTAVPLGPSTKVAPVRLNVISIITLLAISEHFSVYLFIKEQVSSTGEAPAKHCRNELQEK